MILYQKLPIDIIIIIENILKGSIQFYRKKFNIIIKNFQKYPQNKLKSINIQKLDNKIIDDLEDNVFCYYCGEKTLWFPFLLNNKKYCNKCE